MKTSELAHEQARPPQAPTALRMPTTASPPALTFGRPLAPKLEHPLAPTLGNALKSTLTDTLTDSPNRPPAPHATLAQFGAEVARSLSSALERLAALAADARIDHSDLQALREDVDHARRAGIVAQQISRLDSGRVRRVTERLDLTGLLLEALRQRRSDFDARGAEVRTLFAPAEVMGDATLTFGLFQSLFDWALEHAVSPIELRLDIRPWPMQARVSCSFSHRPGDDRRPADAAWLDVETPLLEGMSWCLLAQTATAQGLMLDRQDGGDHRTTLTLAFPQTLAPRAAPGALPQPDPPAPFRNSQPLAGRHALVVASRRELRSLVRDALRPTGLMIDFVNSVDEAAAFCRSDLPDALVYEAVLGGSRLESLRAALLDAAPAMGFVQIAEHGRDFEVVHKGGHAFASVGREALLDALPAAILCELARAEGRAPR